MRVAFHGRSPQPPPQPAKWTIYRAALWLGEVEATDEHEAIEKAAEQFRVPGMKLMARFRRQ
jgi:hypothetical protein